MSYEEWRIAMFNKSYLSLLILILLSFACTREKKPLEPEKPSAIPSTMPQVDIPWPSLADSPWPMALRTPQAVGRTPFRGPRNGEILWQTSVAEKVLAPPVIGPDGTIYVCVEQDTSRTGILYAVTSEGHIKWTFRPTVGLFAKFAGSPIVGVDSTVYLGTWGGTDIGTFYALNPNGTVKWATVLNGATVQYGNNIGLDGTIYTTTTDGFLHAIDPWGSPKWKSFGLAGFESEPSVLMGVISISPDGQTLYLQGLDQSMNAVSAANGSILWQKRMGIKQIGPPAVDSQGNIYCAGTDSTSGSYLFSFYPSGKERWRFQYSAQRDGIRSGITIDREGHIYFQSGSLYSLDYSGHLRWKVTTPGGASYCPLICDYEGIIYFMSIMTGLLQGYSHDGDVSFVKQLYENYTDIGAIGENGVLYTASGAHSKAVKLLAVD